MEIIAIGDTHGRDDWKRITENECDKIVFIGDYVDTHENISPQKQLSNLEELVDFKRANKGKVVLLLGNHDYHYLPGVTAQYSGFQGHMLNSFRGIYKKSIEEGLMQACYVADNVIYSHAGFTRTWCKDNHVDMDNLEEYVNNYFIHNTSKFGFILKKGEYPNPYGDNIFQSPFWVRPESLSFDKVHGFKQVVGHTTKKELTIYNEVAFIDTLGTSGEYLSVIDGEFKKVKTAVKILSEL